MQNTTDDMMVEQTFQHLLDTYLASPHRKKVDVITKAFNFARQAHRGVKRLSGEPYIMHPLAVAQIACEEMGLGSTSISAALLHDVVEDTDYTIEDIENIFGPKVALIVDGMTKISGGIFGEHASAQAENFKKLLLTMSEDIRVILIKICDRLHNMRTLDAQPANKQYKIAGETLYIYAPLAHRLGLNKIKTELENLSFRFEHPEQYQAISSKLESTNEERDMLFNAFTQPIRDMLDSMGISYQIKARVKSPYSIWNKMQKKHIGFNDIYDILAVRVIYNSKTQEEEISDGFKIYVAVSQLYEAHPDRLRDWLNHPKANGYQALHVTMMSKQGRWIEIQIRSQRMDEMAENGFAAHWKYKESKDGGDDDTELNNWLATIKEILDDPQPDAIDFLDAIKLNLYASEIFVFTPKGEIKTMPAGCTALDFAFQIHTFMGTHCLGAKVNHKLVPLSHKLQSGDQVEILTSKSQHVSADWLNMVTTAKARGKILASLRRDQRSLQKLGETKLTEWLHENDMELTIPLLDKITAAHDLNKPENLFVAIAQGTITLDTKILEAVQDKQKKKKNWRKFVPFLKSTPAEKSVAKEKFMVGESFNKKKPVIITEENIDTLNFHSCCRPIPGDDVLGFIERNNQISIHKRNCDIATKLKSSYGDRILDARWNMHRELLFDATIKIKGIDRKGLLYDVSQVISRDMDIYMRQITVSTLENIFDGTIDLKIHDVKELEEIITNLKQVEGLKEVVAL